MASVKKNVAYSVILSGSQYIVPLIVFPYISRILGPENLGLVNFIDGTIDYFITLSMLGMGTLGIREIARHKNDRQNLEMTFSSLLTLNFITTLIACAILTGAFFAFDSLHVHPKLAVIGTLKLIFNFLLIEWFYKGLEEFKFITIRTLIIRLAYIIAIFLLVKNSADYPWYYMIFVGSVVGNASINVIYSRHYAKFRFDRLRLKEFIKPFVILGCYTVLTAMYTTFNIMYLGMVGNDVEVAYYTTSTKIYSIILAMYTAFTGVMMPRLSSLLANGQHDEFRRYIKRSTELLIAFAIPVIVFGMIMAPEIVNLISGPAYDGAVIPMRIVMPLVFIIGIEQVLVYQILIPAKKDHTVFINSIIGAALGIALNLLIVSRYGAIGSSIVWVSCECVILILSQLAVRRFSGICFPMHTFLKNCYVYLPLAILLIAMKEFVTTGYVALLAGIILFTIYSICAQLLVLRNPEFISFINRIRNHGISH